MKLPISKLTLAALGCLATTAFAVPPAWNHVPANAQVVFSISNVGALNDAVNTLASEYGVPMEDQAFGEIAKILDFDGINATGSAVVVITNVAEMAMSAEPPMVVILPVSDYAAFVGNFEGTGDGVEQIWIEGTPLFVKKAGSGFAAMGPSQNLISSIGDSKVNAADLLGTVGLEMVDTNDFLFAASIPALSPFIQMGLAQLPAMAQQAAMMGGAQPEQMEGAFDLIEWLGGGITRDGKSLLAGFDVTDDGITLNLGLQMTSGSEFGNYASGGNGASKLLGRLPTKPFFMAGAIDLSGGGLRDFFKKINEFNAQMAGGQAMSMMKATKLQDKITGMSMIMGTPAALMGGLLAETNAFMASDDPADLLAATNDVYNEMNGQTIQDITYKTAYTRGAVEVDGATFDEWSMGMQFDSSNPTMAQAQMMMSMVFGPAGGPSGYAAATKDGAVFTYSRSTANMTAAMKTANSGNGLNTSTGINAVSGNLPSNRTFEGYIDLGQIAQSVMGMMAMMGGGGMPEIPTDLPPVAAGGTLNDGAFAMAVFISKKTVIGIREVLAPMGIGNVEGDDGDAPGF